MNELFEEWKYEQCINLQKRTIKKLKTKISKEYKKTPDAQTPQAEPQLPKSKQVKWELFIEDIIFLVQVTELKGEMKKNLE
jgi:hypothetical protein